MFQALQHQFIENKAVVPTESGFLGILGFACGQLKEFASVRPDCISVDLCFQRKLGRSPQGFRADSKLRMGAVATLDLFCAQVLTNITQCHELDGLKQITQTQTGYLEQFQQTFQCDTVSGAIVVVNEVLELLQMCSARSSPACSSASQTPRSPHAPDYFRLLPRSPRALFACLIIAGFPALFAEFRGKRLVRLWRGPGSAAAMASAREFH
jgi:hypothetical protein